MVLELCHRHNCTLEIELDIILFAVSGETVANSEWGQVYPNGSSDGLIGSLIDRRSDVAVAAIYRCLYVEQSVPLRNDMMAGSIMLSFLLFGGFMVGNSYAGALASVMTIPRYEKSIDSRADFASSGMKWSGTTVAWMNSLLMAEQPELVTIRNNYEVHDGDTLARFSHTRRDMGYVHERLQYGSYALESFININATRLLQPLKEDVFWEQIITACSKTWPLMGYYDDLILRVQQNGILRYWELGSVIRNMGLEIQRNLANARVHDADHEPVKLLIAHFLGVFFILFVGLTLATVAFITELVVYRAKTGQDIEILA
uniref:Ionotropic glutamate receptor C-terminal domain-containing protein n=1 Tax=Anopheles minimus TaxID=112268 RepID=A0A182VTK7_9DIPT